MDIIITETQMLNPILTVIRKFSVEKEESHKILIYSFIKFYTKFSETKRSERDSKFFNLYEPLPKLHSEELHSRFLAYMLSPNSRHGYGTLFLKLFFEELAKEDCYKWLHGLHSDLELQSAIIEREKFIGWSFDTNDFGRIDLVIETDRCVIAIENKVFAKEQDRQLERYYNFCNARSAFNRRHQQVIFLTRFGHPSAQAKIELYSTLSYQIHIQNWLDAVLKETHNSPDIQYAISSYKEVIIKSILQTKEIKNVMDIKDFLTQPENVDLLKDLNRKDLGHLVDALNDINGKLRLEFLTRIFDRLNELAFSCEPVHRLTEVIAINDIYRSQFRGFRFINDHLWIKLNEESAAVFCIEHDYSNLWFGLFPFKLEDGVPARPDDSLGNEELKTVYNYLNEQLLYSLQAPEYGWWAWKEYYFDHNKSKFNDDSLNYPLKTNMAEIVRDFISKVEDYIHAFKKLIDIRGQSL